jgi:hypothetical protein
MLQKKATVKKVFYQDFTQLNLRLTRWVNDYNMNRKLKSIKFLAPCEKMVEYYQSLNDKKRKQCFCIKPYSKLIIEPLYCET